MKLYEAAATAVQDCIPAALVTVISIEGSSPRHNGAKMLVYDDESIVDTIGGGALEQHAIKVALEVIANNQSQSITVHTTKDLGMCCGGSVSLFIEPLVTTTPAIIFGAGHISHAVAPILHQLGFGVTIVDERSAFNTAQRFPNATRVIENPALWAQDLPGNSKAHWLVVTHDHALDQQIVQQVITRDHAWLGVIGSTAKITKFLLRLRAAGIEEEHLRHLMGPVGLDIGAETPSEIAVAIAAEWVRVRRKATDRPPIPLSSMPITIRGGDGVAVAKASYDT
jgi:xanthine dehydrogenase accessory factor